MPYKWYLYVIHVALSSIPSEIDELIIRALYATNTAVIVCMSSSKDVQRTPFFSCVVWMKKSNLNCLAKSANDDIDALSWCASRTGEAAFQTAGTAISLSLVIIGRRKYTLRNWWQSDKIVYILCSNCNKFQVQWQNYVVFRWLGHYLMQIPCCFFFILNNAYDSLCKTGIFYFEMNLIEDPLHAIAADKLCKLHYDKLNHFEEVIPALYDLNSKRSIRQAVILYAHFMERDFEEK